MNKFVRFSLEIYLIYMHVFLEFITYGMLFKFQFLEPVIVFLISTNNKWFKIRGIGSIFWKCTFSNWTNVMQIKI